MKLANSKGILPKVFLIAGRGLAALVLFGMIWSVVSPVWAAPSTDEIQAPNPAWALHQVDSYHYFLNLTDRSLRYDKNGHPHVVYGGKNLYYAWFDGTNWHQEIVDPSPTVGEYAALALDSNNRPRISYYDASNHALKFAYFNGSIWDTMIVDSPTMIQSELNPESLHRMNPNKEFYKTTADPDNAVGLYTSIAIDTNNVVHISYLDTQAFGNEQNPPGVLKYATWNGVTWQRGIVVDDKNNVGYYSSIAIRPTVNRPCIAYMSELYDDLKYACLRADGSWSTETVDGQGDNVNVGPYASLVFDKNGNPHISYFNFGALNLKYATIKNDAWTISTLDNTGDVGYYSSIAIDTNGKIYISYLDNAQKKLKYMTSSDWSPKNVADVSPGGHYTSIAIDTKNRPGIIYYRTDYAQLIYSYWNGSKWIFTTLDVSGNVGISSSMSLSPTGSPHIGYFNSTSLDLKYAYAFDSIWKKMNVLAGGYQVGYYNSLKLDSFQRPNIAYYDAANGDLKLVSWNGSAWVLKSVDTSANNVGWYVSLALDNANYPHMSYVDATTGDLKYAYWNGSAFVIQVIDTVEDSGKDLAKYTSLALDSANKPYISYYGYDTVNDQVVGGLRFAYKSPIDAWVSETVDNSANVGQFTSLALDNFGQFHISYYDVTNSNLKYALKSGGSWVNETVDSNGTVGLYTSLAADNFGNVHISYYNASYGDLDYAYGSYGAWNTETVAYNGIVGLYTSIDVNGSNQPAISYYDYTNSELWVAMTYPLPEPPYKVRIPYAGKGN